MNQTTPYANTDDSYDGVRRHRKLGCGGMPAVNKLPSWVM